MPPDCRMRDRQPSVDVNIHKATQKLVKKKTLKKNNNNNQAATYSKGLEYL